MVPMFPPSRVDMIDSKIGKDTGQHKQSNINPHPIRTFLPAVHQQSCQRSLDL